MRHAYPKFSIRLESVTPCEKEVTAFIAGGRANKVIATEGSERLWRFIARSGPCGQISRSEALGASR
jgi:hypothetical protein